MLIRNRFCINVPSLYTSTVVPTKPQLKPVCLVTKEALKMKPQRLMKFDAEYVSACDVNGAHGDGRELELGADRCGEEDVNGSDHVRGSLGWWAGCGNWC